MRKNELARKSVLLYPLQAMPSEIESLLEKSAYFTGLSVEGLALMASVAVEETAAKREQIFLEGQKGQAIYLLAEGRVQLVKTSEDGKEIVIRTVEPGKLFAEVILFERERYPVTAIAVSKSRYYKIPRAELLYMLAEEEFRSDFIAALMKRMRYLADRILYLTAYEVEERFIRFVEEQYGVKDEYEIDLSKKDMAAAIGATPETFSRLLQKMKDSGNIEWNGRILRILKRQ